MTRWGVVFIAGQVRLQKRPKGEGAAPYYPLELDSVYRALPGAIASEIICALRYQQRYSVTTGLFHDQIQGILNEHREDEQENLGRIAERLK